LVAYSTLITGVISAAVAINGALLVVPALEDGLNPEPDPKTSVGPLRFLLNKMVSPTAAVAAVVAIAPTTEYNHSIPSNSVNLDVNPILEIGRLAPVV